jgi:hypothetical protein
MALKLFSVLMLAVGEAICIYSEIDIAKTGRVWRDWWIITLAGIPLLFGYYFGQRAFPSMWPVMAASITTILIVEPLTIWFLFGDMPSKVSSISIALGTAGLLLTFYE